MIKGYLLGVILAMIVMVGTLFLWHPGIPFAKPSSSLSSLITSQDALLVAGPEGQILYKKNEKRKRIPASTLKILTALTAIHHLGRAYRFQTEIYQDDDQSLKLKGYGDPLLISEVWQEIAEALAARVRDFKDLVLDDSYFAPDIHIPGVGTSTNPYDARNGALCANLNTVFFRRNKDGRIVSAESQTPMIPLVLEKIKTLGLRRGRHTIFRKHQNLARYAGGLLVHFLKQRGVKLHGKIRSGIVRPRDRLVYTYRSVFTLDEILERMMEYSNNFVANQILIATGAHVHGPPGTLDKGIKVISDYSREVLHLEDIAIAEGSGISRRNRLSALDMLAILKRFKPYRAMLQRNGKILYKSGRLKNVRTNAGYIENESGTPHYFVIFMNRPNPDIESVMGFVKNLKF